MTYTRQCGRHNSTVPKDVTIWILLSCYQSIAFLILNLTLCSSLISVLANESHSKYKCMEEKREFLTIEALRQRCYSYSIHVSYSYIFFCNIMMTVLLHTT